MGIRSSPAEILTLGLMYDYMGNDLQQYKTTFAGLAKARITTSVLSSVVAFDPGKSGFTGQLAGCCGWGHTHNTRYVIYAGQNTTPRGNPNITLSGGLFQMGYNVPISNAMTITPYVEGMIATVNLDEYHEQKGPIPCKVSSHRKTSFERSLGLRHHWTIFDKVQLQTWIIGVLGQYTKGGLHSSSFFSSSLFNVNFPTKK